MEPTGATLLDGLEFIGVVAFALSGAFAAAGRRGDIAMVCVAALVVGLVGGTLDDVLTATPVFWIDRPVYPAACLIVAGGVWALGGRASGGRAALWCDALGLGALAVVGAARGAEVGVAPFAAAIIGVLGVAAAGLARDGFDRQASTLMSHGLYLIAAVAGVVLFVALRMAQVQTSLATIAGAVLAFGLRAEALRKDWRLPGPPEED